MNIYIYFYLLYKKYLSLFIYAYISIYFIETSIKIPNWTREDSEGVCDQLLGSLHTQTSDPG